MTFPEPLSQRTTLRVGGAPLAAVYCADQESLIRAVVAADRDGLPVLVLGGGSNVVVGDAFPGVVVSDARSEITVERDADTALVTATAGTSWDNLVARCVEMGLSGLEALSGIPGSVGAAPVQNIGAYGREMGENLVSVRVLDRASGQVARMEAPDLDLGYRTSVLKQSLRQSPWMPTPRWVVLDVTFALEAKALSAPIRYRELASRLGVDVGGCAPLEEVREGVLELRASKGMVVDPADRDTWSVGSFFTNPIVSKEVSDALPADAVRFPASDGQGVKVSAAWLIQNAGFHKGFSLRPHAGAALSSRHVLAITNRGDATSADVVELARAIQDGVYNHFSIRLEPEPVFVATHL